MNKAMTDAERDFLSGWEQAAQLLHHDGNNSAVLDPEWWLEFNKQYARDAIMQAEEDAKRHPSMRFVYSGKVAANMSAFGEELAICFCPSCFGN